MVVWVSLGCHKKVLQTGWLKIADIYCLTVGKDRSSRSRCWQCHAPSKTCRQEYFFASYSFCFFLAILGILWIIDASLQSLPPSSRGHLLPAHLCLHMVIFLLGHLSCWIRAHANDFILTWLNLPRPYFWIRSPSQVLEIRTSIYLWYIIQPITAV